VVTDNDVVNVVTTDFLAHGGDGAFNDLKSRPGAFQLDGGDPIREHLVRALQARAKRGQKTLAGSSPALFDPAHRRMTNSGQPRARCASE
jgi:hypothetical protein